MNKHLLVAALVAILLVSTFECKKVTKDAKQAKKSKEAKKEKAVEPKVEKAAAPETVEVHIVEESSGVPIVEVVHDVVVEEQPARKNLIKPKTLKVITAYEQCKLECRRQRDEVQAHEYVEQLRAELQAAEAQLAAEEASGAPANV